MRRRQVLGAALPLVFIRGATAAPRSIQVGACCCEQALQANAVVDIERMRPAASSCRSVLAMSAAESSSG